MTAVIQELGAPVLTSAMGSQSFVAQMKSDGMLKQVILVFVGALVLYVAAYSIDRHLRLRNGPWEVTFTTETNGAPAIIVREPKLKIGDLKIVFAGEQTLATVLPQRLVFDAPAKRLPFGECIFDDLMYLPGTETFNLFGHEIELLPRVLIINHQEHPWRSGTTIQLSPAEKPSPKPAAKPYRR